MAVTAVKKKGASEVAKMMMMTMMMMKMRTVKSKMDPTDYASSRFACTTTLWSSRRTGRLW